MTKTLGERRVEEREDAIALVIRTTAPLFKWHPWTIVEVPSEERRLDRSSHDPTYGHRRFRPHRALRPFYSDKITAFVAQWTPCLTEAGAGRRAKRHLAKFLTWRAAQRRVEQAMADQPQPVRPNPGEVETTG